ITLQSTVDSVTGENNALTVNTAGTTRFNGAVGVTRQLSSLTTDAAGTTVIDAASITADILQFNDAVVINASSANLSGVIGVDFMMTVSGTLGSENLHIINSGNVTFHDQ